MLSVKRKKKRWNPGITKLNMPKDLEEIGEVEK
jgi:hypothetical protein